MDRDPGQAGSSDRAPLLLGFVLGTAAGGIVCGAWALLYGAGLTTYPPFDLADLFIRYSPGDVATWAIETFGHTAQRLALAAGVLAWVAGFGLLGLAGARRPAERPLAVAALALAAPAVALAWWAEEGLSAGRLVWLCLAFGATHAAAGWVLGAWLVRLREWQQSSIPAGAWLDEPGDWGRREVLRQAGIAVLALGAGGGLVGRLLRNSGVGDPATAAGTALDTVRADTASPVAGETPLALPTPVPAPELDATFLAPDDVRPRVTTNADFYEVDISTRNPKFDEHEWRLLVHGLVERELEITYADLLTLPAVEQYGTLMCISYTHDNDLISSTRWTGVPLREVLAGAGLRDGAVDIVLHGANGYSDSIPLAKALEATTLLAYGMNGETLPTAHGFPCRVYVPDLYGEKNVKWLRQVEVVDFDYLGYWQERGWTDIAIINVVSVIDTPRGQAARDENGVVPVGGIAFAGSRGIAAVQVRVDDGDWQDAMVESQQPALIWQRWRLDWQASPGEQRLTVRAIDGAGNAQIEDQREPHPDGMTGLHRVTVHVL